MYLKIIQLKYFFFGAQYNLNISSIVTADSTFISALHRETYTTQEGSQCQADQAFDESNPKS